MGQEVHPTNTTHTFCDFKKAIEYFAYTSFLTWLSHFGGLINGDIFMNLLYYFLKHYTVVLFLHLLIGKVAEGGSKKPKNAVILDVWPGP